MPSIPSAFAAFRARWPHLAGRSAGVAGTLDRTMLQSLRRRRQWNRAAPP